MIWIQWSKMLRVLQPLNVSIYTLFAEGALLASSDRIRSIAVLPSRIYSRNGCIPGFLSFLCMNNLWCVNPHFWWVEMSCGSVTSQDMFCPLLGIWWGLQNLVLQIWIRIWRCPRPPSTTQHKTGELRTANWQSVWIHNDAGLALLEEHPSCLWAAMFRRKGTRLTIRPLARLAALSKN